MQLEVELKFPLADRVGIERRLRTLGARFQDSVEQADLYFAHPARDFAHTDEALRVRSVGDANFVTYKGPKLEATSKTRHELELPLPTGTAAREGYCQLLELLGFRRVLEVRKRRCGGVVDWEGRRVELALDEVSGLGTFLEIELTCPPEGLAAARECLESLAAKLGLQQLERRSYLELLLARPAG